MSDASLNKTVKAKAWQAALAVIWPLFAFYVLSFTVAFLFTLLVSALGFNVRDLYDNQSWFRFLFYLILSSAILTATVWPFYKIIFGKKPWRQVLGLNRLPKWGDAGFSLLAAVAYFIISALAIKLVSLIWGGFDADQTQDIGETQPQALIDYVFVVLTLVVLPPLLEETIFRGFIFGGLRQRFGFWFSAILTSIAFGVVHGQYNVGIDVFVLSLFSCFLREKTGSLWSSILLHALKNGLAFLALFVWHVG